MNQTDYFSIFKAAVDLKGKKILEVGGAVPAHLVETSGANSWTAIDLSSARLEGSEGKQNRIYRLIHGDIADYSTIGEFDIVYTTNCFEHILRLDEALDAIFRALKPGGILFSIFAPIWSSPVGHHAYVHFGDRVILNNEGFLPPWYHLAHEENEVREYCSNKYSAEVAEEFCRVTFHSGALNRLVDRDYEDKINQYPYQSILKLRIPTRLKPTKELKATLKDRFPEVRNFSTMGYFWVLKKGKPGVGEILRFYTKGFLKIGLCKARG